MKKILITVLMVVTSYTMASAELGVNIGVSAQIGTMDANGKETSTSAAHTEQKTKNQINYIVHLTSLLSNLFG